MEDDYISTPNGIKQQIQDREHEEEFKNNREEELYDSDFIYKYDRGGRRGDLNFDNG